MANATERASKFAGKIREAAEALKGERGIFRKLKEEHTEIAVLMDRISASTDTDTRIAVFPDVLTELIALGRAEEAECYSALLGYEATRAMARHSLDVQRDIGALLDQIDRTDPREATWSEAFDRMKRLTEQRFSEVVTRPSRTLRHETAAHRTRAERARRRRRGERSRSGAPAKTGREQ